MLARRACLVAALVLGAAACGGGESSRPASSPTQLPDLARALIPAEALERPEETDLSVRECGLRPVYPCVRVYYVTEDIDLGERIALVRGLARSAGWRIVSERRDEGATVEIERGAYAGRYVLEPDENPLTGTMLTVWGPAIPLPSPSAAQRRGWSAEKKAFVRDANGICAAMRDRLTDPDDIAPVLAEGLEELAALDQPGGDEQEVDTILGLLRQLAAAADALTDDQGEDALQAAVAAGELAKRFHAAASRYGLDACATLG